MIARIRQRISELGRLAPLGLAALFLPMAGSAILLTFLSPIGSILRENPTVGAIITFAAVVVFCGLSLLPTNVVGVVSGWAFGFETGIAILIVGILGAAYVSFRLCTRVSGDRLTKQLEHYPRSKAIHRALLHDNPRRTILIVLLLRLSVVMPFAFTNLLLAASRVPFRAFIIGTAIGMLPRAATTTYIGAGLYELDINNAEDTTVFVIGAIASIICISVIAVFSKKALARMTESESS